MVVGTSPQDVVVVQVTAEDAVNLGGFQFNLSYDPRLMQVEDVMLGDLLGSSGRSTVALGPVIDHRIGLLGFGGFSYGEAGGAQGKGTLATIVLRPLNKGRGRLVLSQVQLADTQAQPLAAASVRLEMQQ